MSDAAAALAAFSAAISRAIFASGDSIGAAAAAEAAFLPFLACMNVRLWIVHQREVSNLLYTPAIQHFPIIRQTTDGSIPNM